MSNIYYAALRFSPKGNQIATHYLPARVNEENTVFWYQWEKPGEIFPDGRLAMWNGKIYEAILICQ